MLSCRPARLAVSTIEEASFPDPFPRAFFELLLLRTGEGFRVACKDGAVVMRKQLESGSNSGPGP